MAKWQGGKVKQTFNSRKQISKYFCGKILKIKGFEAQVFKQFFKMNRVKFLLDGFDEISPSFKEFNLSLFRAITRESQNQLWISTRPHFENELFETLSSEDDKNARELGGKFEEIFKEDTVHVLRFFPITKIEQEDFLRRKLESKLTDAGKIEENLHELMRVINKLEKETSDLSPYHDLSPLMLQLIDEICDDDSNFKIMKKYFAKGFEAKADAAKFLTDSTDVMSCLYQKAFELLFGEGHEVFKCFGDAQTLSIEQMARIGFISLNSLQEFEFIHQTFTDFFVADYIFKKIFLTSPEPAEKFLQPVLRTILLKSYQPMLTTFLDGAIRLCLLEQSSEKIKSILREVLGEVEMYFVLFKAILNGHTSISKILRFNLP